MGVVYIYSTDLSRVMVVLQECGETSAFGVLGASMMLDDRYTISALADGGRYRRESNLFSYFCIDHRQSWREAGPRITEQGL